MNFTNLITTEAMRFFGFVLICFFIWMAVFVMIANWLVPIPQTIDPETINAARIIYLR
jgi:hypothetical protein